MLHDGIGLHKVIKRAKASSSSITKVAALASTTPDVVTTTTKGAKVATTTTAPIITSAIVETGTSIAPGVAFTGKSKSISDGPPTTGTLKTAPVNSYGNYSFATVTSGSPTLAAAGALNTSPTGAMPILSHWALIGIIAGAGAVGVAILAMMVWYCCRKYKAKKDEAKWWKLDASLNGPPVLGKSVRLADSDNWGNPPSDEKTYLNDVSPSSTPRSAPPPSNDIPFGRYDFSATPNPPRTVQNSNFSTNINSSNSNAGQQRPSQSEVNRLAREQLLGLAPADSVPARRSPSPHDFAPSFGGSHSSYASSAYGNDASRSVPPPPSFPLPPNPVAAPPTRPSRPYDNPSSSNPTSPMYPDSSISPFADPTVDGGVTVKTKKRQSMFLKTDTTASGGNERWDYPPVPASPSKSKSSRQNNSISSPTSPTAPPSPPRSTKSPASPTSGLSYTLPSPPTRAAVVGSFPTPPHSPALGSNFNSNSNTKISTFAGRVDSKPLRELEDILDSFGYAPTHLPPVPDSVPRQRERSAPSGSLSPVTPVPPRSYVPGSSQYAINHTASVYSHMGDIGELPTSPSTPGSNPASPTKGFGHSQTNYLGGKNDSPTKAATPTRDYFSSQGGETDVFGFQVSTPPLSLTPSSPGAQTHVVRKVSLKKTQAPVLLSRDESLRRHRDRSEEEEVRRPTTAERDIVAQMGFDSPRPDSGTLSESPTSDRSSSPPRTPRDYFNSPPTNKTNYLSDHDKLAANGFVPLDFMTLDPAHQNYRSATESIYGMYDDLPAELQALPRDDPRVSRHISQYGMMAHQR